MGMLGFETYLLKYHKESCPRERISDLVEKWKEETGSETCEAVIDGSYIFREVNAGLDIVSGGEFQAYVSRLESYVKKFTDIRITPVFYFDGAIEDGKRRCWVERKRERLWRIETIYSYVSNLNSGNSPGLRDELLPVGIYECTLIALKKLGFKMITATGDADLDIAQYARDHKSFAIFSRDTDFVALRGAKYYLSAFRKHLRLDEMSTYHFDRDAIAKALRLEPEHLPLLCTLMHSDWVDGRYLVPLYRKLMGTKYKEMSANVYYDLHDLVPELVYFIRRDLAKAADPVAAILDRTFNGYPPFLLRQLAQEILGPKAKPMDLRLGLKEQLELCLSMFEYTPIVAAPSPEPLPEPEIDTEVLELARERHETGQFLQAMIFALMNKRVLNMSPALEDRLLPRSCSAEAALRPLRRRMYGLLRLDWVTEWYTPCVHPEDDLHPAMVNAESPDAVVQPHPGLIALWTSREDDVVAARWRLLAWALSAHRSADALVDALADDLRSMQEREPELVLPTAMLHVLYHSGALGGMGERKEDLVRLLARSCILTRRLTEIQLRELSLTRYDKFAVHLAALFMSTYTHVTMLNDVLGAPVPVLEAQPAMFFNGKLLHKVFMDEMDVTMPQHDLDLEDRIILIACKDVDGIPREE